MWRFRKLNATAEIQVGGLKSEFSENLGKFFKNKTVLWLITENDRQLSVINTCDRTLNKPKYKAPKERIKAQ